MLYRWGNPQAYDQGSNADQRLNKQHDANWIENSLIDGGMIMVFNNQAGSPLNYSEVNIINPPVDANGSYAYSGLAYAPTDFYWTYQSNVSTDFYAANISGAQRLPNGNTLICEGTTGKLFEVDYAGNIVWKYINPVSQTGIVSQGNFISQNNVFRAYRYSVDYAGFDGHTLTPQGYIESGSTFNCNLYTAIDKIKLNPEFVIIQDISQNKLSILSDYELETVSIYTLTGVEMINQSANQKEVTINTEKLSNGLYIIFVLSKQGVAISKKIIISK